MEKFILRQFFGCCVHAMIPRGAFTQHVRKSRDILRHHAMKSHDVCTVKCVGVNGVNSTVLVLRVYGVLKHRILNAFTALSGHGNTGKYLSLVI